MNITKQEALNKIEELKKYVGEIDSKKEEKVIGIAIKNHITGDIIFQSTKTTYREAIIEKGDANLSNSNLRGTNLHGADLRDANLSNANLHGADLSNANLHGADLRDANLSNANLHGADLSNANLHGADLRDANLSNADLRGAELRNAKFYGCGGTKVIKKANLEGFLGALGFILED